jgi:hypothetical protein
MNRFRTYARFDTGLGTIVSANKGVTKAQVRQYCIETGGINSDGTVCCKGVKGTASYCPGDYGPVDPAYPYVSLALTKPGYARVVGVDAGGKATGLTDEFRMYGVADPAKTCVSDCFGKKCADKLLGADDCRKQCEAECAPKPKTPPPGPPGPISQQTFPPPDQGNFLEKHKNPILLGLVLLAVVLTVKK